MLSVFIVLRNVALPVRVEVSGDWRIQRSEEIHDLYSSDFVWSNRVA
jgi:hypothetical protein